MVDEYLRKITKEDDILVGTLLLFFVCSSNEAVAVLKTSNNEKLLERVRRMSERAMALKERESTDNCLFCCS